jgi:predicted DNA-binding protein
MKATTVRLPDDLVHAVEYAAEDTGRCQSEFIRDILRAYFEYRQDVEAGRGRGDRLKELEARVEALEWRQTRGPPSGK